MHFYKSKVKWFFTLYFLMKIFYHPQISLTQTCKSLCCCWWCCWSNAAEAAPSGDGIRPFDRLFPGWPWGRGIKWWGGGRWVECGWPTPLPDGGIGRDGKGCAFGGRGTAPPFGLKSLKKWLTLISGLQYLSSYIAKWMKLLLICEQSFYHKRSPTNIGLGVITPSPIWE